MAENGGDEIDEVLEGYIQHYHLRSDLSKRLMNRALSLITAVRELKRLRFPNRERATNAHAVVTRSLVMTQVYYSSDHPGYNELLSFVSTSLEAATKQIDVRFVS